MYRSLFGQAPRLRRILPRVAFIAPLWLAALLGAADGCRSVAAQEHVPFARLLPGDTLAYVQIPNAAEGRAEWWQTSVGRMVDDPQFRPLVDQTFAAAERAFEPAREQFGLTIAEWLKLPKGEAALAVVPVEGANPAVVLLMDASDEDRSVAALLERGRETATKAGLIEESERVGDVELTIFRTSAGRSREVLYLRRDGKLVIGTNRDVVKKVLQLWNGDGTETLADHPPFTSIERFVGRAENQSVHLLWYIDPINLVRHLLQGNTSAQVALALLPALGLDGVKAAGGSAAFNRGPFDVVGQSYLLLDVPRAGVVELIALRPVPTDPEPWIFDGLSSYTTLSWDIERTYHQLRTLLDNFRGEGSFRKDVQENLKKATDVDIETEVLPNLTGRISFVVANEEPFRLESRGFLIGFEFGDEATIEKLVRQMAEKFKDRWAAVSYGGQTYYHARQPEEAEANTAQPGDDRPRRRNRQNGCFCSLGKYVLLADRPSMMEKALAAAAGEAPRLVDSSDFQLIVGRARRYAGENGPGLFTFSRPVEELRFAHGLAQNEKVRETLAKGAEKNAFLQDFQQALNDRPLPPFEVLEHYFAPGGTIIVDEPTGIRYLSFVLRRE